MPSDEVVVRELIIRWRRLADRPRPDFRPGDVLRQLPGLGSSKILDGRRPIVLFVRAIDESRSYDQGLMKQCAGSLTTIDPDSILALLSPSDPGGAD